MKQAEPKSYLSPDMEMVEISVETGFTGSYYELNYSTDAGASGDIDEVIDGGEF